MVGAFVGQASNVKFEGNVSLENVDVKTVGGRSALLVGLADGTCSRIGNADIQIDKNSKMSIYMNAASEQKFYKELPEGMDYTYDIEDRDQYISSVKDLEATDKTYCVYGYKANALILVQENSNNKVFKAITAVDGIQIATN